MSRKTFRGRLHPTLNKKLDWQSVCRYLNIPYRGESLPARVECPRCQGSVVLYHDTAIGGEWHHCESCDMKGDMIELAASVLNVDAESAAFELLHQHKLEADSASIDRYINEYVLARHNVDAMLERSAKQMKKPPVETLGLMKRLGMTAATNLERTGDLMSQIMGVIHYKNFNIYVRNMRNNPTRNGRNPTLKGSNWGYTIITPYYHLPGHVLGFDIVGRHGHNAGDRTFHPAAPISRKPADNEAGLAGIHSVSAIHDQVIAVRDSVLMGQIQGRAAHREGRLLPVVTWKDDGRYVTKNAWTMLEGANIYFWDTLLDEKLLSQAIRVNGKIRISEVNYQDNDRRHAGMLYNRPDGLGLMRDVKKNAKPWQKVLKAQKKRLGEIGFNKIIAKLEDYGHDIDHINAECSKAGFTVYRSGFVPPKAVRVYDYLVLEQSDRWFVTDMAGRNKQQITDFTVKLDRTFRDSGTKYVGGYLRVDGKKYPFITTTKIISTERDRSLRPWVNGQSLEHDLRALNVKRGWSKTVIEIALKFNKPRPIENTTLNEQRRQMQV